MNALDWIDRAFELLRRSGRGYLLGSWLAGAPLALTGVFVFYLERVEGIRDARGGLALLLCLAWWWRTHTHAVFGGHVFAQLAAPNAAYSVSPLRSLRVASVAGVALGVGLLPAAVMARAGAFGVLIGLAFSVPLGALAPSWLICAGVPSRVGAADYSDALRDAKGLRGSALLLHCLVAVGSLLLFINLLAVVGLTLSALQALVGVEVAALGAFMSIDNDFALVGTAVFALWLMEPLRSAVSVIAALHEHSRRDGADLRRTVHAVTELDGSLRHTPTANRVGSVTLLALLALLGGLALHGSADAQPAPVVAAPGDIVVVAPAADNPVLPSLSTRDSATQAAVARILTGSAYREFHDAPTAPNESRQDNWLTRLLEAIGRWLRELNAGEQEESHEASPMPVPPMWLFALLGGALSVAVAGFLVFSWRRDREPLSALRETLDAAHDPRDRAPEQHLDDAAQLAARGLYRQALRSLYLATLVALDRHGEIDFDPARTNWHYQRQMGHSARAESFRTLTTLFDNKWYGEEPTSQDEFLRARSLALDLASAPLSSVLEPGLSGAHPA